LYRYNGLWPAMVIDSCHDEEVIVSLIWLYGDESVGGRGYIWREIDWDYEVTVI